MPLPMSNQEPYSLDNATWLLTQVDECIRELKRIACLSPRVGLNGVWAWPHTAELDSTKGRLQAMDERLHEYLAAANSEIERLSRNRDVISDHSSRLHGEEAQDHYSQAEDELGVEYGEHVAMRSRIEQKIASAGDALQNAAAPALPCSPPKPQIPQLCDPPLTSSPMMAPPPYQRLSGTAELDGLFKIDRLRM